MKLKPCPFCGGEAKLSNDAGIQAFAVYCSVCGISSPRLNHYTEDDTEHKAIQAWNTRHLKSIPSVEDIGNLTNKHDEDYRRLKDYISPTWIEAIHSMLKGENNGKHK